MWRCTPMLSIILSLCSLFFTALLFLFSIPLFWVIIRLERVSRRAHIWFIAWGVSGIASSGSFIVNSFLQHTFAAMLIPFIGAWFVLLLSIGFLIFYSFAERHFPYDDSSQVNKENTL